MSDYFDKKAQGQKRADLIKERLGKIKHKIVVMSGKGGVGKTTVAVNLAIKLAALGKTVGILDVDITGPNVALMLNMEGTRLEANTEAQTFYPAIGPMNLRVMSMAFLLETNDTPVIWRGPMKMTAIRQFLAEAEWGELDYLIFDLPPGTSDETLDIMQLVEDAGIVIVTTPQDVALLDSRKTVMMSKNIGRKILGVIENMAGYTCPHCGEKVDIFGIGGGERAAEKLNVPFLGRIPIEIEVRIHGDDGLPFIIQNPNSASSLALEHIVKKIENAMESS